MVESYLELPTRDQKDILQTAATQLDKQETVLEKDIWVCWTLQTLFSIPNAHPMAFKGGTSLSKAYNIIERFSEDVDVTLDYRKFDEDFDPFEQGQSRTQINKFSDRLKGHVKKYAIQTVAPFLQEALSKIPAATDSKVDVAKCGEKITISYPSAVEETDKYMKSEVLLELGGRNVIDPNETHEISPDIEKIAPTLSFPKGEVVVLSPERTFWEKASLIHVACHSKKINENADRLSRHWYDLTMLMKHDSGKKAVDNRDLFESVINHKKVFFRTGQANYDACLAGKLKLLPNQEALGVLQKDYEKMVAAGMLYGFPIKFEKIVEEIQAIESNINSW
ncbi:MAG: nucleotidyl transferase AbiEii/AbiGii toxin family protein [Hyphomicrobiaceae bacterium]|nr:nucleotidyl transferase AbiEii/AbiGii toxin family protein [Hyphomicrobiaceae bacterium]